VLLSRLHIAGRQLSATPHHVLLVIAMLKNVEIVAYVLTSAHLSHATYFVNYYGVPGTRALLMMPA
jgi:hypothetical protein